MHRTHRFRPVLTGIVDTLDSWMARHRQRRRLAELSDRDLHDIGITRADVWRECQKPFWRL